MQFVTTLVRWEGELLIVAFIGIVLWKLFTGGINLDQLLEGDIRDPHGESGFTTYVSSGRAQSLLITMFAASYYLLQVIQKPTEFPPVPTALVGAVGGSQVVYLAGKAQAMLLGRLRDLVQ